MRLTLVLVLTLAGCASWRKAPEVLPTDFHMHVHAPKNKKTAPSGDRALRAADSVGLKRVLAVSEGYRQGMKPEDVAKENDYAAGFARQHPGLVAGACALSPLAKNAVEELRRCHGLGLKVLKLHLTASAVDLGRADHLKAVELLLKDAQELEYTVLVHSHYPPRRRSQFTRLLTLIKRFPEIRWILGHALGRDFATLKTFQHPDFYVELSLAPAWAKTKKERENFVATMRAVGINRFLFGSDWPVMHPAEALKSLKALPLKPEEVDTIVRTNASQLDDLFQP